MDKEKEFCDKLFERLKNCTDKWYKDSFLKAQSKENTCKEEYDNYKACVVLLHYQKKSINKNDQ